LSRYGRPEMRKFRILEGEKLALYKMKKKEFIVIYEVLLKFV